MEMCTSGLSSLRLSVSKSSGASPSIVGRNQGDKSFRHGGKTTKLASLTCICSFVASLTMGVGSARIAFAVVTNRGVRGLLDAPAVPMQGAQQSRRHDFRSKSTPTKFRNVVSGAATAALLAMAAYKRQQSRCRTRENSHIRRGASTVRGIGASFNGTAKLGRAEHRGVGVSARASWFSKVFNFLFGRLRSNVEPSQGHTRVGSEEPRIQLVVSSALVASQPLCGLYEEQPVHLNGRAVFKKIGVLEGGQIVHLLFNGAMQWAFTPSADGTPDGWAFVEDTSIATTEIRGVFKVWNGSSWMPDATLRLTRTDGEFAPASTAESKTPFIDNKNVVSAKFGEIGLEGSGTCLSTLAKPLVQMHFKSHWRESQRCLYTWNSVSNDLASRAVPKHEGVQRGVLKNGLRYVIMKNEMPPERFEAHIEVHVGSIDEEPLEQGIAHMMEHVCFLGSRKRERLIGTGSRSNALTDFQHTLYHIHAPVQFEDGREMYIPVLEALREIAFAPEMLPYRIEKERKAVLAEMQQVNDMEYRMETWTLSGLHETNKLGTQFPIGKEEQIRSWKQADLKAFHEKWYYPGNATLYVVGDLPEEVMKKGIENVFASVPTRHDVKLEQGLESVWGEGSSDPRSLFRRKISCPRPEQLHNFSVPMIGTTSFFTDACCFDTSQGEKPWHGPIKIFRNELLEGVQLNFYAKAPVRPLRTLEDIRYLVAVRVLIGVLQFRIVSRYSSNHAPVQIDHSDSFREGCAVTSVTVNADPRDWRNALACVVQEIRAVCDFGITDSEMQRYMTAMLKDVQKGVLDNDTVASEDHLNFLLTSDVFNHTIMHPELSFDAFREVASRVNIAMVHNVAKWMFGFIAYYGQAFAPSTTAIVVCTPTQIYEEHGGDLQGFHIIEEDIVDLMLAIPSKSRHDALNIVDVPESLLDDHFMKSLTPLPIDAATSWRAISRKVDNETGIVQLMLPNGAKVNYKSTPNESQGTLRLLLPGGRSADRPDEVGAAMVGTRTISEAGAVGSFSREQIELFAVSNLTSIHLDLSLEFLVVDATFSVGDSGIAAALELLHLMFQEPRWELPAFIRAQQAYRAQANAVHKSLEQSTLNRLMQMMYGSDLRVAEARVDDLSKLTLAKVRRAITKQLRPQDMEINLVADFEGKYQSRVVHMEGGLSTGKHREDGETAQVDGTELPREVKDRRLQELDETLWRYLGSIPAREPLHREFIQAPQILAELDAAPESRERVAHIQDSDERAVANIGGGAPNRWGKGDAYHSKVMSLRGFSWDSPNSELKDHPLYPSMCLLALREVIHTRLFSTVRDSLGLSYDCSFELSMLDSLEAGWFVCTVSAHPSRIGEAVEAAKGVLSGVRKRPISDLELGTARRTLLRRHETDLQSNDYWIFLMSGLQRDNPKDISCVRDIEGVLNGLRADDLQNSYDSLLTDADQVFVSITTAGRGASFVSGGVTPAAVSTRVPVQETVHVD
eukprot:TRINITY_DN74169_c0_g1_i1.p1 TRINITY_DN74169_c0_g1~~TRINITY_DN74169_c0_g1_i1.p1  ORF type:complete len:1468 (+),score=168.81 TRINITY_DN74169_c0_g1_i1:121-4524(+)